MDMQGEDLFQDHPGAPDSDEDVVNDGIEDDVDGLFRDDDEPQQDDGIALGGEAESARMELGEDPQAADAKKKRVIRNPQPKLDLTRISGPRGLGVLEEIFENFEPRGKGREFDDLDVVLSKMEHWAHRLYPKLPFDDVMERISQLGTKMAVKTYLKKLRLGMDTTMSATVEQDADDAENERRIEQVEDPADSIFPPASPRRYDDPDDFDEVVNEFERERDDDFDTLAAEMEMEREAFSLPDSADNTQPKNTQESASQDPDLRVEDSPDKENVPQSTISSDSDDPEH